MPIPNYNEHQLRLPFEPEHSEAPEILVIGDALEDHWYECDSIAISAEAPVPMVKVSRNSKYPIVLGGGAGNVSANLEAMGWNVRRCRQKYGIPVKVRYCYQGHQVFRVDFHDRVASPINNDDLVDELNYAGVKGLPVVVADYNKGAVDEIVLQSIRTSIVTRGLPFYIHTKKSQDQFLGQFIKHSSNLVFFYNEKETKSFKDAVLHNTVVTKGAEGAWSWVDNTTNTTNAPVPGHVRSTCGAGDVFMSAYITAKELYGHSNPLAIADAVAKKTVCECDYTCVYRGGF